jgi:hypothetical protein
VKLEPSALLDIVEEDKYVCLFVCLMLLNATFNSISALSLRTDLLVEETGVPGENH